MLSLIHISSDEEVIKILSKSNYDAVLISHYHEAVSYTHLDVYKRQQLQPKG